MPTQPSIPVESRQSVVGQFQRLLNLSEIMPSKLAMIPECSPDNHATDHALKHSHAGDKTDDQADDESKSRAAPDC